MTIDFDKLQGLVPVVIQDDATAEVLMVGFMNREALERTSTGNSVVFWSRSRGILWKKGETSGNDLRVISITPDCDNDALLIRVEPAGPTCHTGERSCFGAGAVVQPGTLKRLERVIHERKSQPTPGSRTAKLFSRGSLRIAQKVGEEAVETILASTGEDNAPTVSEAADLLYHLTVLFAAKGITWSDVEKELRDRME